MQKGNPLVTAIFGVVPNSIHSWIIDSGATDHMTSCSKMFFSYSRCAGNKKVNYVDGSLLAIAEMGTIKLTSLITLQDGFIFLICLAICYPSVNLLLLINVKLIFTLLIVSFRI